MLIKILVVDDSASDRLIITNMLKDYAVQTARDGMEALRMLQEHADIQLMILDLNMPGMSGRTCLQELLRMDPDAKVLIASGYTVDNQAEKMIRAGALGFIAKPYQISDLVAKVGELLDRSA